MPEIALNLVCPESGCRFYSTLTCQTRKAQLNSGKAADRFLLSFRDAEICKTCPGPVPISQYKPKPKRNYYVEVPPAITEEKPVAPVRGKGTWKGKQVERKHKLHEMHIGEVKLIPIPKEMKISTLKSQVAREMKALKGRFYRTRLVNGKHALRVEREI